MNNEKRLDIFKEIKKEELNKLTVLDKIDYLNKRGYFAIKNPNFEGPDESTAPISVLRSSIPIENAVRFEEGMSEDGRFEEFKVFDSSDKLIGIVRERNDYSGYNYFPESTSEPTPVFNIGDYVEGLKLIGDTVKAINIKSKKEEVIKSNLSPRFKGVIFKVLNNEELDPDSVETLGTFLRNLKKRGFIKEDVEISLSEFKEDNKKQCENIINLSLI